MDENNYPTLEDAPMIAKQLIAGSGVIFSYQCTRHTNMVIFINPPATQIGRLAYGGQAIGRYCVGIVYRGFFHLDLPTEQHASYIAEKLNLPEVDAVGVTGMLNAIGTALND
jgi:hypothetical protein